MKIEPVNLDKRLLQLRENLSEKRDIIEDSVVSICGSEHTYIIFISVSDGYSRAQVYKGHGAQFETAWGSVQNEFMSNVKKNALMPLWIKVDLVFTVKEYSLNEFITYASSIKRNYFREGIAFDSSFSQAFLEQEVNGNVFLHESKEQKNTHLVPKNIDFYLKRHLRADSLLEIDEDSKIYTFKTISVFHDGMYCFDLENRGLDTGRRSMGIPDSETIRVIIEKSSHYLTRQVKKNGQFVYGYFPCFDKEIEFYNILRHASTTYAMIEAYEISNSQGLKSAIYSAITHLEKNHIETLTCEDGISRSFVIERSSGNEIKLGANAATLLALAKLSTVFKETRFNQLMDSLAEGILFFQNDVDGSFVHVLNYPDLSVKEKHRIVYYDGEAAFALMRCYGIDKNPRWLEAVVRAFDYFIVNEYWKHNDHWLSYCSNELIKYVPEKRYVQFNLKNASGILDFCLTRETTFPTLLELLMATNSTIDMLKQKEIYPELSAQFDVNKMKRAINHRVQHQLNGLMFPEVAMYFKSPLKILWGFFIRHHSFRVRIDDVEHNISGYCAYVKYLDSIGRD